MMDFLYWIVYGVSLWLGYILILSTSFYFADKYHRADIMFLVAATARSFMFVIPLSWLVYGVYLILN